MKGGRDQWLDETDLPWVFPSPNMSTVMSAIYPGMCLIEGTTGPKEEGHATISSGRCTMDGSRTIYRPTKRGAAEAALHGVAGLRVLSRGFRNMLQHLVMALRCSFPIGPRSPICWAW